MWNANVNSKPLRLAAALALPFGAAVVIACGPDFPLQVLNDRAGTLKATPANSFAYEAAHLARSSDKLQANENDGAYAAPGKLSAADAADAAFMTPAQRAQLKAVRALKDGDAAYAQGADLPPAVRLYAAGAVDYLAAGAARARAQKRFQAVLDLPRDDGDKRAVWAAYMLGQSHAGAMSGAGNKPAEERAKATQAYTLARARAAAGAPDPNGLAVASYGEQARVFLVKGATPCGYLDFVNATPCADDVPAADLKQAIHLYAEQAARNSDSGVQSLRSIAAWALSDPERAQKLIDDPLSQRLLVSYALARVGDMNGDDASQPAEYDIWGGGYGYVDAARGAKDARVNPVLPSLVAALEKQGIALIADADRVAALAYRSGYYDLAQTLADRQRSALGSWVRAKLALRKGDVATAAQAYAEASKAFPQNDASVEPASLGLIKAEQSVLTLSRGQYVEAFDQLYNVTRAGQTREKEGSLSHPLYGDYSGDTWYLAERVLTVDELKTYVDAHVPATPVPAPPQKLPATPDKPYYEWLSAHPAQLSDYLRRLLARRLVREGRVADALPYFPDDQDLRYVDVDENYYTDGKRTLATWRYRATAKEYGDALNDAKHAWRAVTRAEAWYKAATLARRRGMEIMGYEEAPDYAGLGGMLAFGIGRTEVREYPHGDTSKAPLVKTPEQRAAADLPGPFVTADERKRYAASESKPNVRYHYRNIAADYIMKAADELPPRSQAFAAVLCQGAGFVYYDAALAPTLYRRYVKQGAAVPFSADFGQNCVEPDFKAAGRFPYVQAWKKTRHWVATHRALGVALLVALLAGAAALGVIAARAIKRHRSEQKSGPKNAEAAQD
ncbi:hypothetical protein PMI16_04359 [Herbaspirillum sp. CF444]|nr:hypothetical protein PMI16_04359 [Herbaspirillum sp. CF444]